MYRVGIIGPESSGKTTLARYLAKRYEGTYVPEYERTYMEQKGGEATYEDVCTIARHQLEVLAEQKDGLYFFDAGGIVTKVWFDRCFGGAPEWFVEGLKRYPMDCYLLTRPDIAWVPDAVRTNGSDAIRQELFRVYEEEIQQTDTPYYIIAHSKQ